MVVKPLCTLDGTMLRLPIELMLCRPLLLLTC
jgi:hypothetical protein